MIKKVLSRLGVQDTATDEASDVAISSEWAYEHENDADGHHSEAHALDSHSVPTGPLTLDSQNITDLANAVNPTDAANLNDILEHVGVALNYWFGNATLEHDLTESETQLQETPNETPDTLSIITFKSTVADTPAPFTITAGSIIEVHFSAEEASSGGRACGLHCVFGYMDAGGSSGFNQIGDDSDSTGVISSKTAYTLHIHVSSATTVSAGKRLWLKFVATSLSGGGGYPTLNVFYNSAIHHLLLPVAGSVLGNFIQKAIVDAKGDLISATADDTLTILPVGTDNYGLFADSGAASGLKWKELPYIDAQNDFGILADGVTDNYAAIQLLITAVNALGGARIQWPQGTILIDQYAITGGGSANGIIPFTFQSVNGLVLHVEGTKFDHKGDFLRADDGDGRSYSNGIPWQFLDCNNVFIFGGEWDGNVNDMTREAVSETAKAGASGHGLQFNGTTNIYMVNTEIHHFSVDGIVIRANSDHDPLPSCENFLFVNVNSHSNGRQGMTISSLNTAKFINCHFDHTGHTDAAGTAVGSYTGHAPQAGVDIEGTPETVGSGNNQVTLWTGNIRFDGCTFANNVGFSFTCQASSFTKDATFENCLFDASDSSKTFDFEVRMYEARFINCTLILMNGVGVRIGKLTDHKHVDGASWASDLITFDYGDAYHGLKPGDATVIASSNPADYDGNRIVVTTPSLTTFTCYEPADPGAWVSGSSFTRPVFTIFEGCTFVSDYNCLTHDANSDIHDVDYIIRNNKFYLQGSTPTVGIVNLEYNGLEFSGNYLWIGAQMHDQSSDDTGSVLRYIDVIRNNTYETDLVDAGDASDFFNTDYLGSIDVSGERFISGSYWRPETGEGGLTSVWTPPAVTDVSWYPWGMINGFPTGILLDAHGREIFLV